MDRKKMAEDAMPQPEGRSYALSGKIMLTSIVVLLFIIALMIALHFYARWYLLRARRRSIRRRSRRTHLVFYMEPLSGAAAAAPSRGLDPNVLKSLPVFVYSPDSDDAAPECAVCLSEFEEKETGRLLPKCNHRFHTECIDMWFCTHSTCPLCRSPVEAPEKPADVAVDVCEPGSASVSETCAACRHEESSSSSSSSTVAGRRKLGGVSIEIPGSNFESAAGELSESPASQGGFRSPMSRMLSFTRILSRDSRRGSLTCSGAGEGDVERGRETTTATATATATTTTSQEANSG